MYCQLGNTFFENLKTFNDFSNSGSATYAEHAVIEGKPKLQFTGVSLEEIRLSIRLHVSFCNPLNELDNLTSCRNDAEILPLLWGNGVFDGYYVITDLQYTIEDQDPQGNVFSYIVSLTLKEYVVKDRVQQLQNESRHNAKAVGDKKPVAKKKTNPSTCPKVISGIVSRIQSHQAIISALVIEKGGLAITQSGVTSHLSAIRRLAEDLIKRCDDSKSCANAYPDLRYRAVQVQLATDEWDSDLKRGKTDNGPARNQILAACVRNLKAAAMPLTQQAITRK